MLVHVEAYLGPNKPETLAEATFEVSREPQYAVVTQNRETGDTQIWDVYASEQRAADWTESLTNSVQFGILCVVRTSEASLLDLPHALGSEDPELALEVAK